MSTSGCSAAPVGDLLVGDAAAGRWPCSASTVKTTAAMLRSPVVRGDLVEGRAYASRALKYFAEASSSSSCSEQCARGRRPRRGCARRSRPGRRGPWHRGPQAFAGSGSCCAGMPTAGSRGEPRRPRRRRSSSALQPPSANAPTDLGRVRPERQPVAADADGLAGDARGRVGGEEGDQAGARPRACRSHSRRAQAGSGSPCRQRLDVGREERASSRSSRWRRPGRRR